jgi:glycosyltransferase involved in cell wall biosynthesis
MGEAVCSCPKLLILAGIEIAPEACVNEEPTIAVVIPVFRGAHCIRAALDSVMMQSHPASEIIVIDDGSPDESGAIAASYGDKVRVIRQENGGMGSARNAGIRCAASNWISFLDQDDTYHIDRLKKIREAALSSPSAKWIYSDCTMFDVNTKARTYCTTPEPSAYEKEFRYVCGFMPSLSTIRKDALVEVGGFNKQDELVGVDDHLLILQFMRKFGASAFVRVPEPLSVYTVHDTNFSRRIADHFRGRVALLPYQIDDLTGMERWIWKRILMARLYFDMSIMLREQFQQGYFQQALWSLLQWPFPHRALPLRRYKVFAHMLLTRLGVISLPEHSSGKP